MTLLKKVSQPIETANGLPNPLYTDPAVYAEESRRLLLGNWSGIAFEGDVPEVGDVYPVELAGVPLVVVSRHAAVPSIYRRERARPRARPASPGPVPLGTAFYCCALMI